MKESSEVKEYRVVSIQYVWQLLEQLKQITRKNHFLMAFRPSRRKVKELKWPKKTKGSSMLNQFGEEKTHKDGTMNNITLFSAALHV